MSRAKEFSLSEEERVSIRDRIEKKTVKQKCHYTDMSDCWDWSGSLDPQGYGYISVRNQTRKAHRIAYAAYFSDIPDGYCVCHRCDNPKCTNPEHLFLGTELDNARDRKKKGRQQCGDNHYSRRYPEKLARGERHFSRTQPDRVARGDRNGARTKPEKVNKGESHGMAKLSEINVLEIRSRHLNGTSTKLLASEFCVTRDAIANIVKRRSWKHIP